MYVFSYIHYDFQTNHAPQTRKITFLSNIRRENIMKPEDVDLGRLKKFSDKHLKVNSEIIFDEFFKYILE